MKKEKNKTNRITEHKKTSSKKEKKLQFFGVFLK